MDLIRKQGNYNLLMSWNSRTNRILIKWVNDNGWIDIFVIKENHFFCSYFRHISLCFYSNFKRESSLDVEFNFAIIIMFFSSTYCFWGSGFHQKYVASVLIGCGIKFHIQQALSLRIWVKTQGDRSKIRTKEVVLFYNKYVNSTIMVDSFYWNSIGSWIPTHQEIMVGSFFNKAYFRAQNSSNEGHQ